MSIEEIKLKLSTDQKWIERAILRLYERQTCEEQESEETKVLNGRGFNAPDAKRLSYYAKYLKSGNHLSGSHLDRAKRSLPKYASQIHEMITLQKSC